MRILSTLTLFALFATAFLAVATPAEARVDPCQTYSVCPIVVVENDRICAGLGLGLQGAAACANASGCATVYYGFNQERVCTTMVGSTVDALVVLP